MVYVMVKIAAFSFLISTSKLLASKTRNTVFNLISHPKKGFLLSTSTPRSFPMGQLPATMISTLRTQQLSKRI